MKTDCGHCLRSGAASYVPLTHCVAGTGAVSRAPAGETNFAQTRASESQDIRFALERHGFNRLAAARELGLHKSTLFRKLKALGIELPDQDGRSRRT